MYSLLRRPKNGEIIKITWLPKNNAYPAENCYIGSVGVVEDSDAIGIVLRYESGASLIITGHFFYRLITGTKVKCNGVCKPAVMTYDQDCPIHGWLFYFK